MSYKWDKNQAKFNYQEYKVNFADTASVFFNDAAIILSKYLNKKRFVTIGINALKEILVVAYTKHKDNIWIISALRQRNYEV